MRTFLALTVVSILLLACDDSTPTAGAGGTIPFTTIAEAHTSGFSTPQRSVLTTEDEWAQAWQTIHAGQNPVPPRPPVDFSREAVILAAAGNRANGCYSIAITEVRRTIDGADVVVTETVPGPACICIQIIVQPVHAVRIEPLPGNVLFTGRSRPLDC